MSLKVRTLKGVTTLTWESPTMGAFWKIRPEMTDEEIIEVLTNVVITMKGARMDREARIFELETELGIAVPTAASGPAAPTTGSPTPRTASAGPAGSVVPPAEPGKILMMPPSSLGDAPAGGAPANQDLWSGLPSDAVPDHLSKDWSMAPPEEMERW